MTERRVSVRMTAVGGQQVKAELQGIGDAGAVAMNRVSVETDGLNRSMMNLSGGARSGLRNAGLQLNQVAQQGLATGNYLQALAIQLPDLLIGFGTMGIAAGIAAGVLAPLALSFFDNAEGARSLEDELKSLRDIMEALQAPMDVLNLSADEMTARYGAAAQSVRELALAQAQIAADQAARRLEDINAVIGDQIDLYAEGVRVLDEFGASVDFSEAIRQVAEDFGISGEQAAQLRLQLTELAGAEGADGLRTALLDTLAVLESMNVSVSQIPDGLQDAISEAITLTREMDAAAAAADRARSGGLQQNTGVPLYMQGVDSLLPPSPRPEPGRAVRRGGGGGGTRVDTEARRREQEARRLFDQTRTEAEQYAAEVERINQLHAEFGSIVTDEVVARALADLDSGLNAAGSGMRSFQSSAESAFVSFVTGAASAREAISSLLGSLGQLFAQQAFRSLVAGGFGSLGLPGFANGTSFAPGGLAIVGERGPEIVNLPRGSQVFSNETSRRMAGGVTVAPVFNIDARGGAADDTIRAMRASILPEVERIAVAAVRNAGRRGY